MRRFVSLILAITLLGTQVASASPGKGSTAPSTARGELPAASAARVIETASLGAPATPQPEGESGLVIVKFKDGTSTSTPDEVIASRGARRAKTISARKKVYSAKPPKDKTTEEFIEELEANPQVEYAEPDYFRQLSAYTAPNDPALSDSTTWESGGNYYVNGRRWWLDQMNAVDAWQSGFADDSALSHPLRGSAAGFKVAVLDSGFYLNHPELSGKVLAGKDVFASFDWTTGLYTTDDDVAPHPGTDVSFASHGTGVAGTVASKANNGLGGVGVGYDAQVIAYKVAGPVYGGSGVGLPEGTVTILDSAVASAIYLAVDAGAKVINMSLGGDYPSTTYQNAVNYAHSKGVIVVASTGNDGIGTVLYPAACDNVIGVGALGATGGSWTTMGTITRASFSNYGPRCDITAPGVLMWLPIEPTYDADGAGTTYQPGYYFWSGTSFASPAVAGAIAYLWRANPALTKAQMEGLILNQGVTDLGAPGRDDQYGYGALDMGKAYDSMIAQYPRLQAPAAVNVAALTNDSTPYVSWSGVAGTSVIYDVYVDGSLKAGVMGTSHTLGTALSDGVHTVSVQPRSDYNWFGAESRRSAPFTVDTSKPVVSNLTRVGLTFSWSDTESTSSHTTMVWLDSEAPVSVTGNSYTVPGLEDGTHTFHVSVTDAAGNVSDATSLTFDYSSAPGVPALPAAVTSVEQDYTLDWPDVPTVDGYEVEFNGAAPYTVASSQSGLTLDPHANTVRVRSVKAGVASEWAVSTVSWEPPVPASPVVIAPSAVYDVAEAGVIWSPVAHAQSYEYKLGSSGVALSTTSAAATIAGLTEGDNVIFVRAVNFNGYSAWTQKTITYYPPTPGGVTFDQSFSVALSTKPVEISWGAVAGASRYEFTVNGGSLDVTNGRSISIATPSRGENTVRVRAANFTGSSDWQTVTFHWFPPQPTAAPAFTSPNEFSGDPEAVISWTPLEDADYYEYSLNGADPVETLVSESGPLTLRPRANTIRVRAVNTTGAGPWSSEHTVTYYPPPPAAPEPGTLSMVVHSSPVVIAWPAVPGAEGYECKVGLDGVEQTLLEPRLERAFLPGGENLIYVRARNFGGASAWVLVTVDYVLPIPAPPVVQSFSVPIATTSTQVIWGGVEHAEFYEYRVNSGQVRRVSSTSAAISGLRYGANVVEVRAGNGSGLSDWSHVDVAVQTQAAMLSISPGARVTYGGYVSVSGSLSSATGAVSGQPVDLYVSYNEGASWSRLVGLETDAYGKWTHRFRPARNLSLQARFGGSADGRFRAAPNAGTWVIVRPALTRPKLGTSKVYRNRSFAVRGYLKPRFTSGTRPVKLRFYRYQSGRWVLKKTVSAKASKYSSYSKVTAKTSLKNRGRWYVVATYAGSATYGAHKSSRRYFRVY